MSTGSEHPRGSGRDPRSIVTPDAFVVSEELLGTALAPPGRRLAAIVLDLLVIAVITGLTKSFALVLGVVASVLFIRAGFRRVAVPGSAFGRAMRASVGCLGIVIGLLTVVLWTAFGVDLGGADDRPRTVNVGGSALPLDVATGVLAATSGIAFAQAPDLESARAAGEQIVAVGRDLELPEEEIAWVLQELVPPEAGWAPEATELIEALLADQTAVGGVEAGAVESGSVLPDTVQILADQVEALAAELRSAREAAEESRPSDDGLLGGLRGFLDELGFGFGWASLYLTVMLPWWKGQTVGKRLLGIRVVRLDGEPVTWWTAFERAGGYAAGFATGLLGFAQVYWDANRQAIHDRIVGTVVVREGAPRVTDWESAL